MVVAAALNKDGVMSIVDVILIICGIYCLYTAGKMKREHQIPKWLFSEQELYHIRQPKEFCEARPLFLAYYACFLVHGD